MACLQKNKGVTLLLSVLIISASLSIAFMIFFLYMTEIKLSRVEKASNVAFYSADSGKECVLYYLYHSVEDPVWGPKITGVLGPIAILKGGVFARYDDGTGSISYFISPGAVETIKCFGSNSISVKADSNNGVGSEDFFNFNFDIPSSGNSPGLCGDVSVKIEYGSPPPLQKRFKILKIVADSFGKNSCGGGFRVERAIRTSVPPEF